MKNNRQVRAINTSDNSDIVRVLHVDDMPDLAKLTATFLEREDSRFNVEIVTSASDGFDRLDDTMFDCVISDHDMPGQNGIEFLKIVRQNYPDIPFIIYTAKGSEEIASDAISAGATDYLRKETGSDHYKIMATRIWSYVERTRAQCSHKRLLKAIETTNEGIAIYDSGGSCLYANKKYADIYGFEPVEMYHMPWKDLYSPEEILYSHDEILTTVDTEGYWRGQVTNVDADGNTFRADHSISITEDGGFVCTTRRLSEQNEMKDRLSHFETVIETLTDPVYVCGNQGRFQYVNDAFADLVGYERERIIGSHTRLIKNEYAVAKAEQNLRRILSSDGPTSATFEVNIQPKNGDPILCEDHMGVIPYDGPRFSSSVGILRDISTRTQRERTLERQNRQLNEFAKTVSHDLRNPLAIAEGNIELLRNEHEFEQIETIDRALTRMSELIDDLLELARGAKRTTEADVVDLGALTESCWQNVETFEATIRVETDRTIRANKSRLAQLLENLIRNAVEHGGQDVTITVGELDNGFYVEDDGTGIPENKRKKVFEMGYSTATGGTGFGLPIVKQVSEAHGWEVSATDSSNGGAHFEITGVEFDAL